MKEGWEQNGKAREDAMERRVEGTELGEEKFAIVMNAIPEDLRPEVRRVLAESIPPPGAEGVVPYIAIWELNDGRWMRVDMMIAGERNVSTLRLKDKKVVRGETEVSGTDVRADVKTEYPEKLLDPLELPEVYYRRLREKLNAKLESLGGAYTRHRLPDLQDMRAARYRKLADEEFGGPENARDSLRQLETILTWDGDEAARRDDILMLQRLEKYFADCGDAEAVNRAQKLRQKWDSMEW